NIANPATERARRREPAWLLARLAAGAARSSIKRDSSPLIEHAPLVRARGRLSRNVARIATGKDAWSASAPSNCGFRPVSILARGFAFKGKANRAPTADRPAIFTWFSK